MALLLAPKTCARVGRWSVLLASVLAAVAADVSQVVGAVTPVGDVSPAPPAGGGNVAAPLRVGNTGTGTLAVTLGTPLTVVGGSAVFGDAATAVGIVTIRDLGSNFSSTNLTIGNNGAGSLALSALAKANLSSDLVLATNIGASGDLFIDGLGTLVDVADDVFVGSAGAGLVQITNGGRLQGDAANLGQFAGSDGRATISGHLSLWEQANTMTIGDAGRGELQVLGQGRTESAATTLGNAVTGEGVAVVNGAGSIWAISGPITVGASGRALLNVLDGGRVTNTQAARIASNGGSEAHVVVSGANSVWANANTLVVGGSGFGTLDVRNGGRVTSTNAILGDNGTARGDVVVDGGGSTWQITGTLDVSEPGESQLTISNGGLVSTTGVARVAAAGRLNMAGGRIDVAAPGGLTNSGLVEGGGRIGALVTNAATGKIRTRAGDVLLLANNLTNNGLVDLTGGELETSGSLTNNGDIDARNSSLRLGGNGLDNNAGAQLAITSGVVDVYGRVDNNADAEVVVGGGATAVFHDELINNGDFFVIQGAQALVLESLSFMPTAALSLQLGPADAESEFGPLGVTGPASLAGALNVTLASGYSPNVGDAFEVLTASGGVTGTFGMESLPALAGGLAWDVAYAATRVTLNVVGGLSADFDQDGDVDAMDLAAWKAGFGTGSNAERNDGDADADGDVDGADFLAWQRELGNESSIAPSATAVPEPNSWTLAVAALAMLARCRVGRSVFP